MLIDGQLYHVGSRLRMWAPARLSCPHCRRGVTTKVTYVKGKFYDQGDNVEKEYY
jgi:hypothetical protein